jgi:hypothetical protein
MRARGCTGSQTQLVHPDFAPRSRLAVFTTSAGGDGRHPVRTGDPLAPEARPHAAGACRHSLDWRGPIGAALRVRIRARRSE